MKKIILRCLLPPIFTVVLVSLLYLGIAFGLALFPLNSDLPASPPTIRAYVASNGVHTDFVFPIANAVIDWRDIFALSDFKSPGAVDVIMISWGDEQFFINTPTWDDLTLPTALNALFVPSSSVVHVTYYRESGLWGDVYSLNLSEDQYRALVNFVKSNLQWHDNKPVLIDNVAYGYNDAFYRAEGSYTLFRTCNTWVGEGLREAGLTVSLWTPFVDNVVKYLPVKE